MPTSKSRSVFISYSRKDKIVAQKISADLEKLGFNIWWDHELVGGERYRDTIHSELEKAGKVIVLWSKHSVKSDFVIDEAAKAKRLGKLVPISIDGSEPPLGFGSNHTIDFRNYTDINLELLKAALNNTKPSDDLVAAAASQIPDSFSLLLRKSDDASSSVGWLTNNVSLYVTWLITILTSPKKLIATTHNIRAENKTVSYMVLIVGISIFLGATIGANLPDRIKLMDQLTIFAVVSVIWLLWSLLIHAVCKLFKGTETVGITVMLTMQILSFAYVASNIIVLTTTILAKFYPAIDPLMDSIIFSDGPATAIVMTQMIILFILIPLVIGTAHQFRSFALLSIAIFAVLTSFIIFSPIVVAGGC